MYSFEYEYTDTFGGDANYSWVNRGNVVAKDHITAMKLARSCVGLTGVKGDYLKYGDTAEWRPRNITTVLFVDMKV